MIFLIPFPADSYCGECAKKINLFNLLISISLVPVLFVLAVIVFS